MIKIIVLPIHVDLEVYVKEKQLSAQEAKTAFEVGVGIFEKEQQRLGEMLDVALNNGFKIIDKEVIKNYGATKVFYVLHKQELIPPPSEGS